MIDSSRNMALFDMDGTLTGARELLKPNMVVALEELSEFSQIGIVSGSDFGLIKEQVIDLLPKSILKNVVAFPCNGTQAYFYDGGGYEQAYYVDMVDQIGKANFLDLFNFIIKQQIVVCDDNPDINIRGNFIENRGSMLNYCIPGRSASAKERKNFEFIDLTRSIRLQLLTRIKTFISRKALDLSASIGGKTSIDIFPRGWDKTYVMQHLGEYDKITFVGDACYMSGNDKELYDLQQEVDNLVCFKTDSTDITKALIKEKIIPIMSL